MVSWFPHPHPRGNIEPSEQVMEEYMAGDQKLPIRQADPIEARKGVFLKDFPLSQVKEMLAYCGQTKVAMARYEVHGEIVFTRMNRWGKRGDSWQVFLLP